MREYISGYARVYDSVYHTLCARAEPTTPYTLDLLSAVQYGPSVAVRGYSPRIVASLVGAREGQQSADCCSSWPP